MDPKEVDNARTFKYIEKYEEPDLSIYSPSFSNH